MKNFFLLNMNAKISRLLCLLLLSFSAVIASAQSPVATDTNDLLIEKFRQIRLQLAPSDESRVAVTLRLADLLSEKARKLAVNELDQGCSQCTSGQKEREEALRYYDDVVTHLPESQQGKVLSQMGHLYELNGQTARAMELYQKVVGGNSTPSMKAEAHLSLGEVAFRRGEFANAIKHYEQVTGGQVGRRGLAAYRKAWSMFNLGQVAEATQALVEILENPILLSRGGGEVVNVDVQFKEEVSRDLATFYAKRGAGLAEAKVLYGQSTASTRVSNVAYLASELERVGNLSSAVEVWRFALAKQELPQARLESHIRLAQLEYHLANKPQAVKDFTQGMELWPSVDACRSGECDELKSRSRRFLLEWNRVEKKQPSELLLASYKIFLQSFPEDLDIRLYLAQAYRLRNDWRASYDEYGKLALLIKTQPNLAKSFAEVPQHEATLLSQIELAELSKDTDFRIQAYQNYLAQSGSKTAELSVRYQMAHLLYQGERYAQAADAFYQLAMSDLSGEQSLKVKAADLALDSLALTKDDARIEQWSAALAQRYADKAIEYQKLSRQSVLNQATKTYADSGAAESAWAVLMRANMSGADEAEKIAYYKNKLILAEKLKKYGEAKQAVSQLLSFNSLKAEDKTYVLSRKIWLAELSLDFTTAFQASKKLQSEDLKPSARLLRLALLAELAGESPEKYFEDFLQRSESDNEAKRQAIAARLVREAKEPLKVLRQYQSILAVQPELYSELYLEILAKMDFAKKQTQKIAASFLQQKVFQSTASARVIWRQNFLHRLSDFKRTISEHKIDIQSQSNMTKNIKRRVQLLGRGDHLLTEAGERKDWTAQMLMVELLGKENERFYQEIIGLPLPDGLSQEQQSEYLQLLSQRAAPHQIRAQELQTKFAEFWQRDIVADFRASLNKATTNLRPLVESEMAWVQPLAPEVIQPQLAQLRDQVKDEQTLPSLAELESARQKVRQNPDSQMDLQALIRLEKKMGRDVMVGYLQSRLSTLQENTEEANSAVAR